MLFTVLSWSHAASQLVKGLHVKPQVFESVTLLFTNISNFRRISETSTPHEVIHRFQSECIFLFLMLYTVFFFIKHIRMLDDLYNIFDSVVQRYHVYKVETVKDTYFVVNYFFFYLLKL